MGPPGQPLTGPSAASPAGLGFKVSGSEVNLEPESGRNKLVRLAGGLLAALVLILVLFFIFRDDQSQEIAGPPPGGPRGEPMTIEQIRTDSPVLNPSKTINRARNLADTAEDRNQELKNIEKDLE
jgi:hypothetical protein